MGSIRANSSVGCGVKERKTSVMRLYNCNTLCMGLKYGGGLHLYSFVSFPLSFANEYLAFLKKHRRTVAPRYVNLCPVQIYY